MMVEKRGATYWLVVAAGFVALIYANYFLRSTLETSGQYMYNFYRYFYPDAEKLIFGPDFPWWKRLLPFPNMTGSWSPGVLVLTHYITDWLGPAQTWYVTNALVMVVSFGLSWPIFKSRVFGFTLAICMGFGTHLYYVYPNSALIGFPFLFIYFLTLLLCMVRVVTAETYRPFWIAAYAVSVLVTALSYETWLDFLVFIWLASSAVGAILWHEQRQVWLKRLAACTAAITLVGIAYVYIKVTWGYGQQHGMESDVVFNYRFVWPAIEDLVSNAFLNLYMTLTTFLPPMLVSSTAFYQLGGDQLVEMQHGYHAPFSYLVPMQAMFMWRYFAGVLATLFAIAFVRSALGAWRSPTMYRVAGLVFMIMIATGGPTHAIIKARPLNSMAVQTYHVLTGVLGLSLLIALLLMLAWRRWPRAATGGAIVAGTWAVIFYSALARPGMISHQAAQSGLGVQVYPNPMATLVRKLGLPYSAPAGQALYQLDRFAPPPSGPPLSRLPLVAPPLNEWVPSNDVRVEKSGSAWLLFGNTTPSGTQLVSAPIPVTPDQQLVVMVAGVSLAGRVCVGVLPPQGTAWLLPPDAARGYHAVDTGIHATVRLSLVNCQAEPASAVATKTRVDDVTYALVPKP